MAISEAKQIRQSGATQSGYLSTIDWNTFNDKQDALTNGVDLLTSGEVIQLSNIGATTIDLASWTAVGGMNQGVATGDSVTFAGLTVPLIISSANLDLKSTLATGLVRILDNTGAVVFSYNNSTDTFTFNDDLDVTIGGEINVNTINTYNSIAGVTIEGVALEGGNITLAANKKIKMGDGVDIAFDIVAIDTDEAADCLLQYNNMNSIAGAAQTLRWRNPNATDRAAFMTESIGTHAENYLTTRASGSTTYSYYGYMENGIPSSAGGDRRMFEVGMNTTTNTYRIGYGSKTAGQSMSFTNHLTVDGATGAITASGYINQAGISAEIYVADASTAQSIATGVTYTKSTAFTTDGQSSNCTSDAANDKITITQLGKYTVTASVSATSGSAAVTFRGAAFLNGVEQDQCHFKRKYQTATDSGSASFSGDIDVTSVPWDLDLRFRHDNGGAINYTVEYANLHVKYWGAT